MPRDKAKVESSLKSKGFKKEEKDHHYFIYYTTEGKKTAIKTKTSHSKKVKDISDNILTQMAKQCHLDRPSFLELIDCTLDQNQYESYLKEKGIFTS